MRGRFQPILLADAGITASAMARFIYDPPQLIDPQGTAGPLNLSKGLQRLRMGWVARFLALSQNIIESFAETGAKEGLPLLGGVTRTSILSPAVTATV